MIDKLKSKLIEPSCLKPSKGEKRAAVAIILRFNDGKKREFNVLFVKRAENNADPWSGHVALPGGMFEEGDGDICETVIREVYEEVGIDLRRNGQLLGVLREFHPTNQPEIKVTPFVYLLEGESIVKMGREIDSFFWASVNELKEKEVEKMIWGEKRKVIIVKGRIIWGMTYRVVRELINIWKIV